MEPRFTRPKAPSLDRPLWGSRSEVPAGAFALLFSELVQYSQRRVRSVAELQARLARLGRHVGPRALEALAARERPGRRDTRLLPALLFVKGPLWRGLFGREAERLEQANDDARTYYVIEREPLVNAFVSVPRHNSSLNCAAFTAGLLEAALAAGGFPARVTAHWHKGTTLMIKFEEGVIARERSLEGR
ncbi:trafficking protein particle complex subunit 5 [Melopsittacus undulatus]|uniref:Trafficking protein particle complex subunit 5 n=1 Tax=Melopsittacus undulatus TaxID=13146 RepID=A0A8V5GVL2_MELUD|nr:trafficking protein particle complex subunit 5 [Melopsittacus undulatus]